MSTPPSHRHPTRRLVLQGVGMAALTPWWAKAAANPASGPLLTRPVPSTGDRVPVIGMGTWITFNLMPVPGLREPRVDVVEAFFAHGGRLIDSSPMYGWSEEVVGECLAALGGPPSDLLAATKVWTPIGWMGDNQIEASFRLWGVERIDLLQVHNLVAWETHLPRIRELKEAGRVRWVGVTTSHGRRHDELERVMRSEPLDFVQLTYNAVDREAERRLLPLAAERGIAVIANRPFQGGALIEAAERHPLPAWAAEVGATGWAQLLLKLIVGHPAVTCAIPATTRVDHVVENLGAARGPLPDARLRRRIADAAARF